MVLLSVLTASCEKTNSKLQDILFERYVAREVKDDGWVFSFIYQKMKDPSDENEGFVRYQFFGINIKYLSDRQYSVENVQENEKTIYRTRYVPPVSVWGQCSDAQQRDMVKVYDQILIQTHTPEMLINMDYEDYEFEELDGKMLFELIRRALTGPPHEVTSDIAKMEFPACLQEKQYLEGYKFQVSFLNAMGIFDVVHIDILFEEDGELLSDKVRSDSCSRLQTEVYDIINQIEDTIEGTDTINPKDIYERDNVENINMKRLYKMLEDINEYQYDEYKIEPLILENEIVEKNNHD